MVRRVLSTGKPGIAIFQMLITGKNNTQIADELFISEHTVRNYVSKIYASLNLRIRSAAIQWARENGFF